MNNGYGATCASNFILHTGFSTFVHPISQITLLFLYLVPLVDFLMKISSSDWNVVQLGISSSLISFSTTVLTAFSSISGAFSTIFVSFLMDFLVFHVHHHFFAAII